MKRKKLANKPLVEAIFELRWELPPQENEGQKDLRNKILVGRLYDKEKNEYSFLEELPAANVPYQFASHVVQYRFRKNKDEWPLVQVGPGILTLNDTSGYTWENFEQRTKILLDTFFSIYPDLETLHLSQIALRYIDAIHFDFENTDVFLFLKEKMKLEVNFLSGVFENPGVKSSPLNFDLKFSFPSTNPRGEIFSRFTRGKTKGMDALVWESMVQSSGEDVPQTKDNIIKWVNDAHDLVVYGWFFKIIAGELEERFQ